MEKLRHQYASAVEALNRRAWAQARQLAEPLLRHWPEHAGLHFVIGVAALEQAAWKDAFRHLLMASRLNPERPDYAAQFARLLLECQQPDDALAQAERAMALQPSDPVTLNTLAVVFTRCAEHARAAGTFKAAVEQAPDEPSLRFNLATALTATGDIAGAIAACEACIRLQPTYWRAHLTLAQLSRQTPERNHVERLQALLERHPDPSAQLHLHLALEKEFDDLGEPQRAMSHLIAGKAAWRPQLNRSGPSDASVFEAIEQASQVLTSAGAGYRGAPPTPIFIVGMPRSGTTLVERILSSHSQVHSAGELQHFPVAFKKAAGVPSPWILDPATLAAAHRIDWRALGRDYLQLAHSAAGSKACFVDKLPQNFLYLGWIAQALPDARIICLRRDPMDTCIANFRQLFAPTPQYNYSFDLLDVGRYYIGFDRLMAHWNRLLPDRILEIDYEDIVEQQAASTRKLLAFCGLDWDDACLSFERNAAPVATASAVQVRSPIYRSSLGRWKRYGESVEPLRQLLAQAGLVDSADPRVERG
ncbi:tetratricopeptide repeat-containing sulfotransferase family protein [Pseudoxanthomonas winnipegensis]|jgi:tetratricopeptide (TPR) repeat protein|uniref:Sulfotransferase family protein n=1 Tax=Pseudoxanthomonas winnipegensis TaxID=2480810 RepID=A0A4Q8L538_9GAMM|nr:sulfotransferase [Pseudoxanthomonas winnipegensis]TAA20383.1 sulfotransferase family protein [Pseudoxanthomonas winnipegensis]